MSFDLPAGCPAPIRHSTHILLGHGSGGRLGTELIERVIVPAFHNATLAALDDSAVLSLEGAHAGGARVAFTTDSFVVSPLFFPGGDIGSLSIYGTVNDLAVSGARPLALSLAFILEEGTPFEVLERVIASAREAARRAEISIVTGDTKVVGRGKGDGIFITTSGIGLVPAGVRLGSAEVRPGDVILLSGTVGDHGVAILKEREGLALEGPVASDCAPLSSLCAAVLEAAPSTHAMRDPTRGGLAATLVEIASRRDLGVVVDEAAVPVDDVVRGAAELLGLDPFIIANEGKLVAFVPEDEADAALAAMRAHPLGRRAARIGRVREEEPGLVIVRTPVGGMRILDLPYAEPLPRIC